MTTAAAPVVFFGRRDSGRLLRAGATHTDDSEPFLTLARTNRAAPAGPAGEAIFVHAYLTVTHADALAVSVTPIVDDARLETVVVSLGATGGAPVTEVRELSLAYAYARDGVERARFAPRGTWIQIEVELAEPIDSGVIEQVDVEYEIVRESK